ncbi:capsular polysaccharide biosynthesis protein [Halomonas sp. TBZ9]|uniref:Capsular polysaccharide biosynthesis protein n=1 Tax=Vreelandella azerica TaxID=2732867 RepID=A0A7Y3X9W8_9GAMM|nr:capsular polysaccharide biosynthesis protein [Halomonas azerica]NOG30704.1 capsular polysaccharide biosynthesis protein [Halomonas azerica]
MEKVTAGYTSQGIRNIVALDAFLPEISRFKRLAPFTSKPDAVVGWGLKPTSQHARQYAKRHQLPYLALEDGFLRSLGLGSQGYQPVSMVVDQLGIYYDASGPSDLEELLNHADFSEQELERAEHCIQQLTVHRLSKYNHAPDQPLELPDKPHVLVVDQTAGDASIAYGQANAESFNAMLEAALSQHPDADILIKVHPDVIAGKKSGHFSSAFDHPRCRVIGEDINPWALFDCVEHVYVVTSQLGFEALLAGKQVHCFGQPFYAGWGLTHDALKCPRRQRQRHLKEVFAGAYLRYTRYANPYTREASTLEACIDLIADQRRQQERYRGEWLACGFSGWKKRFIGDFLGDQARITYQSELPDTASSSNASTSARVLTWASRLKTAKTGSTAEIWKMEDGFVRSVGLGVDLTQPLSLVIDQSGIYYDARQPSDLEQILSQHDFDQHLCQRASRIRQRLVALKLSKYNIKGEQSIDFPANRRIVLVPGQVESDASIACGSPQIQTNAALLAAVRQAEPDALIAYKAHPDVVGGARLGQLSADAHSHYDIDVSQCDISTLLERVDAVHTMSSLTGFEALLRGKQVYTHGLPFYAGWGLTEDALACPRRQRQLSLDALLAGTLIIYPGYADPTTHQLCHIESVITLLEQARLRPRHLTWKQQLYRHYRNLLIGRH